MNKILAGAAALALLGGGVYFALRNTKFPPDGAAAGTIGKSASVKSICVTPIQNFSHKQLRLDGLDDELVGQLQKVGFAARKLADGGSCDASTNAEVVEVSGRGRKTARVDFRLTLANEQVPRMSSSVEGKSGGKDDATEFTPNPDSKEAAGAEHQAIVAALNKTATQIAAANQRGLPQWQAKDAN